MVGHLSILHPAVEHNLARSPRTLCAVPSPVSYAGCGVEYSPRVRPGMAKCLAPMAGRYRCGSTCLDPYSKSLSPRSILRYTLSTYASTIASQHAQNRHFGSHNGCSSVLVLFPAGHSCSPQGTNPAVRVALVLSEYSAGKTLRQRRRD